MSYLNEPVHRISDVWQGATVTPLVNLDSASFVSGFYAVVDGAVIAWFTANVDQITAAIATQLSISLPVPKVLAAASDVAGVTGQSGLSGGYSGRISGRLSTNGADVFFSGGDLATTLHGWFSYRLD